MELTALIQNTLWISISIYGVSIIFQIYMLYLNWRQAKVKDITKELLKEIVIVKEELIKMNNKLA